MNERTSSSVMFARRAMAFTNTQMKTACDFFCHLCVSLCVRASCRARVSREIREQQCCHCTIYVRFNVAYGAPAPREGVQPEEGGTLQGWGYIRVLPARGYRH